jgi:hypothetical protein
MSTWLDEQDQAKVTAALEKFRASTDHIAESAKRYGGDDERFDFWLYLIDRKVSRALGLSIFDLVDGPWRDYYDSGLSPMAAFSSYREDGYDELLSMVE